MIPKERKKRVSIQKDVVINRTVRAEGLDLSEDGMYIYTRTEFIPRSIIELSFVIDGERLDIPAIVSHAQQGIGIGVRFVDMPPEVLEKIKRFISVNSRKNGLNGP